VAATGSSSGRPFPSIPDFQVAVFPALAIVYNRVYLYTSEAIMRTNVVIDDSLMESALKSSGLKTKKDAIEAGLKLLVKFKRQAKIRNYRGKLRWVGNLDEMRTDQ
jgi:Arc/MetJ family transcription regulator